MRMTAEQFEQWRKQKSSNVLPKKVNKYRNEPIVVNGIRFHSRKEAYRYESLLMLEKHGDIQGLRLQPEFVLQEAFDLGGAHYRAITYIGDFAFMDMGKVVVEDVKPKNKKTGKFFTTEVFNIKRKMFIKRYPDMELRLI